MGFRSTLITEGFSGIKVPQWFLDKHTGLQGGKVYNHLAGDTVFPISSVMESKFYSKLSEDERLLDIQKIIKEAGCADIIVVILHECGGLTRVKITPDSITAKEPLTWKDVEEVEHNYCYKCVENLPTTLEDKN